MSTSRRYERYRPTATPQVKDLDRVMEPHRGWPVLGVFVMNSVHAGGDSGSPAPGGWRNSGEGPEVVRSALGARSGPIYAQLHRIRTAAYQSVAAAFRGRPGLRSHRSANALIASRSHSRPVRSSYTGSGKPE